MTFAATLCTKEISDTISENPPYVFMHGPTFMANPLACSVALASIRLLEASNWQEKVFNIENFLRKGLQECEQFDAVKDIRVLGAIGVIELRHDVNMAKIQQAFVDMGVWIRPFGKLIYLMPPYIIKQQEINTLTNAVFDVINNGKYR